MWSFTARAIWLYGPRGWPDLSLACQGSKPGSHNQALPKAKQQPITNMTPVSSMPVAPVSQSSSAAVKVSSIRAEPRPLSSAVTYATAAKCDDQVYKKHVMGIAKVHAWLNADKGRRHNFYIDDGCNLSCISEEQSASDHDVILQSGQVCGLATPVPAALMDGQAIKATKMVRGLVFSVGVAKYVADSLSF